MRQKLLQLLKTHGLRIVGFLIWTGVLFAFFYAKTTLGLSFVDLLKKIFFILNESSLGPLLFIAVFLIRPILLFPSSLIMALGGAVFGFWLGFLYSLVAGTLSALIAYLMARYFTDDLLMNPNHPLLLKWKKESQEHPFATVMIMRLLFLPFDLVNFICGYLKISWKPFALATFLAIIVDSGGFISAGASIENIESFNPSQISINILQLIVSFIIIALSLGIAIVLHRRRNKINTV